MTETKITTKFFNVDGEIVDADTLDMLRSGGRWIANKFDSDPDPWGADAWFSTVDEFGEDRGRTLALCANAGDYEEAECLHDEDVSAVNEKTGAYRTSPYENYVYRCETCGAIGYPDGPNETGGESIDWNVR